MQIVTHEPSGTHRKGAEPAKSKPTIPVRKMLKNAPGNDMQHGRDRNHVRRGKGSPNG